MQTPKTILCIHSLTGTGRSSLSIITPVLNAMGHSVIPLPTAVLSTHTGGLGVPARLDTTAYCAAALAHYAGIGLAVDCIFSGYLAEPGQAELVLQAYRQWPNAFKVLDPAMGDNGRLYTGLGTDIVQAMRRVAAGADLILPNLTEAHLLADRPVPADDTHQPTEAFRVAEALAEKTPAVLITSVPMGSALACVAAGRTAFVHRTARIPRRSHGTGDLFAAVLIGSLLRGAALSAAADTAARFVAQAILATPETADPRLGLWFEPLLHQLPPTPKEETT